MKKFAAAALALTIACQLQAVEKSLDVTLDDDNRLSFAVTEELTWSVDGPTLTIAPAGESPAILELDNVKSVAYTDHESVAIAPSIIASDVRIALCGREIAISSAGAAATCRLSGIDGREIISRQFDDVTTIGVGRPGIYILTVNNSLSLKVAVK